ncbi:TLC domain-containing protein 2-like [Scleropages formosus]|uniref:TLC domain-containing protein 2-like n=1 Tax=Scleropages formosus TaxID=113540 RepID=A0A0P7WQR1_SCLFO|nr:TLC domain-containing protein 2-like [Scleropages formosus]
MDSNAVIMTAGASVGFFKLVNTALKRLPVPESACRNPWKWRNISTSLVHSLITGFWAVLWSVFQLYRLTVTQNVVAGLLSQWQWHNTLLVSYNFCVHPEMAEDLRSTHTVFSHALVSVSIGYFIYDFFDMFLNQKISQAWELLFHHTVVVCCFGLSALTQQFVGFSVVALLVEINSVFLHLRQALRMAGLSGTMPYRLNRALNLGTYVVFRISTLAWMTRWLVLNRSHIPLPSYTVGSLGLAIMTAMNIVLFCRLLRSDVLKVGSEGKREK